MNSRLYNELTTLNINLHNKITCPKGGTFHLHDTYEVLFLISGDVSYFVDNNTYPLKYGDLVITNTSEIHTPIFLSSETYERIIFHFSPELAKYMSTPDYNLEKCFIDRPNGKRNKTALNDCQITKFMDFYRKIRL